MMKVKYNFKHETGGYGGCVLDLIVLAVFIWAVVQAAKFL